MQRVRRLGMGDRTSRAECNMLSDGRVPCVGVRDREVLEG